MSLKGSEAGHRTRITASCSDDPKQYVLRNLIHMLIIKALFPCKSHVENRVPLETWLAYCILPPPHSSQVKPIS